MPSEKFAVVFYGWYTSSATFVTIVVTFPAQCGTKYTVVLLGLSTLENVERQSAEEDVALFSYVLALDGNGATNVAAIIGDNFATIIVVCFFIDLFNGHPSVARVIGSSCQ